MLPTLTQTRSRIAISTTRFTKEPALYKLLPKSFVALTRNISSAFLLNIIGAALGLLLTIIVARILPTEQAGYYFLGITIATILSTASRLGLDGTITRHTAMNAATSNWSAIRNIHTLSLYLGVPIAVTCMAFLYVFNSWIADHLFRKPDFSPYLLAFGLAVPGMVLMNVYAQLLKGMKHTALSSLIQSVLFRLFSVLLVVLFVQAFGYIGAAWNYSASVVLCAIIGYFFWSHKTPRSLPDPTHPTRAQLLSSCLPLFVVTLCQLLMTWGSTLLVGRWGTPDDIAIYSVATRTVTLTSLILIAVNTVAAPRFTELFARSKSELAREASATTAILLIAATIACGIVVALASPILALFGSTFAKHPLVLQILGLAQFALIAGGAAQTLLVMTGNEVLMRNAYIFCTIGSIFLNFALVPEYGAVGASIATLIVAIWQSLYGTILVRRKIGIDVFSFRALRKPPE